MSDTNVKERAVSERIIFFENLGKMFFFSMVSAAIFISLAVLIFVIRSREPERISMPDIVGKYYVDVYNDLARTRLQLHISKLRFQDRPPGVILYQSIPAGAIAHPGDTLDLTINQPEPMVRMPDLMSTSVSTAESVIKRINYDDEVYSLKIGAITRIHVEGIPPETVLAQFPASGDMISPLDRVYLLVSTRSRQLNNGSEEDAQKSLNGQHISILNEYYIRRGIDYRIKKLEDAPERWQSGSIASVAAGKDGVQNVTVFYTKPLARYRQGLELIDMELDEDGECQVVVQEQGYDGSDVKRIVFSSKKHALDETVRVLYYRRGDSYVTGSCGEESVYSKKIKPDTLS